MLNRILKDFSREKLVSLMKLSPALADQTYLRIREFAISTAVRRPAVFAYSGTAFQALDPGSLSTDQCRFAQQHLRILSGMYGILQPMNEIYPYRLEMKTPINVPGGESLLSFWKPRIMEYLISGLNRWLIRMHSEWGIPGAIDSMSPSATRQTGCSSETECDL